jgi:hypothetical protein
VQNLSLTSEITDSEREKLEIALGVLRSGTDYADFLQSWLLDYGTRILSSNPPAPLLEPWPSEGADVCEDVLSSDQIWDWIQ